MVKDNNVNITIEVCKDKISGKLYIQAHFNIKAPNVLMDNDYYTWMPTIEEQNLLNEAFEFMPMDFSPSITETKKPIIEEKIEEKTSSNISTKEETNLKPEVNIEKKDEKPDVTQTVDKPEVTQTVDKPEVNIEQKEEKTSSNFSTREETNLRPEVNIVEKEEIIEEKREVTPTIEKPRESDIFEITNENIKTDIKKDDGNKTESTFEKMSEPLEKKQEKEEPLSSKIEEDDGIIVEADFDAIEAALEKHIGTKDNTIVEADEKTIIDRVLKQKKKGKWRE